MTQKDKELLLQDLCARLPYGIKGNYQNSDDKLLRSITIKYGSLEPDGMVMTGDIKPYLFPLSSMTEEQKEEYYSLADDVTIKPGQGSYLGIKIHCIKLGISDNPHEEVWDYIDIRAIDWLNKNHFDYRGLIPKGLAIDCTNLNIY